MAEVLFDSPPHWQKTTLEPNELEGFIVSVETGGTPSTAIEEYWAGNIPWLTPKEITGNTEQIYVSRTERCISEQGLANSGAVLLPAGTVFLTKRAPVGAVAINAVPMATNQGFLNFRCGPKLRPLFLAYWLKVNTQYLQQVANGSTYRELYLSDLFEFVLAVPPVEEQDAIVSVINAIQFLSLMSLPIEQSVASPDELPEVQHQTHRLLGIRDAILIRLLDGSLDTSQVSKLFGVTPQ
jgi:type I restriction enzyme S subunit